MSQSAFTSAWEQLRAVRLQHKTLTHFSYSPECKQGAMRITHMTYQRAVALGFHLLTEQPYARDKFRSGRFVEIQMHSADWTSILTELPNTTMGAVEIDADGTYSLFGYPVIRGDDYPYQSGPTFLEWASLTEFNKLGPLTSREAEKYWSAAIQTVFTCRRCNRPVEAERLTKRDIWEGECLCGLKTQFTTRLARDAIANYCAREYMVREPGKYQYLHEVETGEQWTTRMLQSIAQRLREGQTGGERADS